MPPFSRTRTRLRAASALALSAALLLTPAPVLAAGTSATGESGDAPVTCADLTVAPGQVRCFSTVDPAASAASDAAADSPVSTPGGLSPQDIASIYQLPAIPAVVPTGSGPTVAVVVAGGTPTLQSDLAAYRTQYGLGACTVASACLRILDQGGASGSQPGVIDGWDLETALDAEAVAAACPTCRILVVQADSADSTDLDEAIEIAADRAPYVSMSFGSDDEDIRRSSDVAGTEAIFSHHPSVTFVASSGDLGWVTRDASTGAYVCGRRATYAVGASHSCTQYPSTSPRVISVGGTRAVNTGTPDAPVWTQTVWYPGGGSLNAGGASSGCSGFAAMPSAQALAAGAVAACGGARASTDLSAVAGDFAVYHADGGQGWWVMGGTSLSAPLVAAMYARAGNHTAPFDIYRRAASTPSAFADVTTGSTRGCSTTLDVLHLCSAGAGWDGPTGLGAPLGLAGLTPYGSPVTTAGTTPTRPAPATLTPVTHTGRLSVRGKLRIRRTLRASYGAFTPGSSVTVTWVVDGRRVATGTTLRVRRGWRGLRIRYVATATAPGHTALTMTSPTVRVRR